MSARERDKSLDYTKLDKERKIEVPHVTVRESISILLIKLLLLEIIAAVLLIVLRPFLFSQQLSLTIPYFDLFSLRFFILAVVIKMVLTIYIILSWLNEYYEITPKLVLHREGIIFVKKEHLALDDIQSVTLDQGIIGRILNFGTLSLYDWKWRKHEYLYGVHNPMKYVRIIEALLPNIDEEKHIIRENIMEEEEDLEEI